MESAYTLRRLLVRHILAESALPLRGIGATLLRRTVKVRIRRLVIALSAMIIALGLNARPAEASFCSYYECVNSCYDNPSALCQPHLVGCTNPGYSCGWNVSVCDWNQFLLSCTGQR